MRKLFTAAFAALAFTFCATPIEAQTIPLLESVFVRVGGTFTTGDRPFHDAAGAYTFGSKKVLTWAESDDGFEYPASLVLVGFSTTPIGSNEVDVNNDVTSFDLGFENHIRLGIWKDTRIMFVTEAAQEVNDPSGPENGFLGLTLGLSKNLTWNPLKRSGLVVDVAYSTFKRDTKPYGKLNMTLTLFLPKS